MNHVKKTQFQLTFYTKSIFFLPFIAPTCMNKKLRKFRTVTVTQGRQKFGVKCAGNLKEKSRSIAFCRVMAQNVEGRTLAPTPVFLGFKIDLY